MGRQDGFFKWQSFRDKLDVIRKAMLGTVFGFSKLNIAIGNEVRVHRNIDILQRQLLIQKFSHHSLRSLNGGFHADVEENVHKASYDAEESWRFARHIG